MHEWHLSILYTLRGITHHHTVGTHGIIGAKVTTTDDQHNTVIINIRYSIHSRARGTLLVFTPVESETVQRSILLVLERNDSHNHTLSLNSLPPAQYLVLVYEVNREGSLSSGVSYPAVVCELNASHFKKRYATIFFRLVHVLINWVDSTNIDY